MKLMTCEITGKKHRNWITMHKAIHNKIKGLTVKRGYYDEIDYIGVINDDSRVDYRTNVSVQLLRLFEPILDDSYIETRKGRGSCLNHDLYGYDAHQGVAIIQSRETMITKYGNSSRKTYFLIGRNEITEEFFRHPVSAHTVRAAIKKNPSLDYVVTAVQRWMWEVTEKQLKESTRQGDILLVPEKRIPKDSDTIYQQIEISESHILSAEKILRNGRVYALNPTMIHAKGQHATVTLEGWHTIRIGRDVPAWDFSVRKGD